MSKIAIFLIILSVTAIAILYAQQSKEIGLKEVNSIFNQEGKIQPDGVVKYSWPRKDLKVQVNGVDIEAGLALGSWAAFKKLESDQAMAMGDLVLLTTEVNPVIQQLQSGGIEIAAVHNHLFAETPQIIYVHFDGHGTANHLAQTLKDAIAKTSTPQQSVAKPTSANATTQQIFDEIQKSIERKGNISGKLLQINVPRKEKIQEGDHEIPPTMGMSTAMNFQVVDQRVATTGDFVLIADEVNPVIKELQANGIEVTALHSHMLRETPRLFFMHFWGLDSPQKISAGLKAAISHLSK
jgi:biotin operon repressor